MPTTNKSNNNNDDDPTISIVSIFTFITVITIVITEHKLKLGDRTRGQRIKQSKNMKYSVKHLLWGPTKQMLHT